MSGYVLMPVSPARSGKSGAPAPEPDSALNALASPMEAHSAYHGDDWSPQRLVFHQNLESFAERVGLVVGLQSNGKVSQEQAYGQIRRIWKELKESKDALLNSTKENS